MKLPPLSRCAASPKGDDSFAARRRLLAVSGLGRASFEACRLEGGCDVIDI